MPPSNVCSAVTDALSPADVLLFQRYGFGVARKPAFSCVHHAFEHHARVQPNAIAVEHCGSSITYRELDRKANGLATRLRALGVHPGTRVCLLVQRSISMVVGILGILKAGAAYVPLDGSIVTQSTLEHVLHDSQAVLVLALKEFVHRVSDSPVVCLEDTIDSLSLEECSKPMDMSSPDDGVYIIYTSGMSNILSLSINTQSLTRNYWQTKGRRGYASQCNES